MDRAGHAQNTSTASGEAPNPMPHENLIPLDGGKLLVSELFLPVLRANGLDAFQKVMHHSSGTIVRSVPGRSTVQIQLGRTGESPVMGYLKRYEAGYLSAWKWRLRALHWPGAQDEAAQEWQAILSLRQRGFNTAAPVALGQRWRGGAVIESFLLQQEIVGGIPADDYLLQKLASVPAQRKWDFLRQLGRLTATFHAARFIHKDFYLKHVFVVERAAGWELFLIDLQRVLGPGRHRARWYLKDLGALAHSARFQARLTRTNLLRLYLAYAGMEKLGAGDRARIIRIWQRVRVFQKRQPKYRRVWNAPPPQPRAT